MRRIWFPAVDGPRKPGYYASVTGSTARHELVPPNDYAPPKYLVGQVHRYGPRRWWVRGWMAFILQAQDVELVFETPYVEVTSDVMSPQWTETADHLQRLAANEAMRLNAIDPNALGL